MGTDARPGFIVPGVPRRFGLSQDSRCPTATAAGPDIRPPPGLCVVVAIAVATLVLHLATASRYGYFGDELYFISLVVFVAARGKDYYLSPAFATLFAGGAVALEGLTETRRRPLPIHFAWQFGWDEMVAAVAQTYEGRAPSERERTAILGSNYGESGAVDLLGARYGLPKPVGTDQSYWL